MSVAGSIAASGKDECRVSVVIPCYKQARYLATAIQSVLNQTIRDVEIIAVDDGSPDETASVAAGFKELIELIQQANAGVGAARNAGLARCKGMYVHFLDADDRLWPDALETHLRWMEESGADVTCSGWRDVDSSGAGLSSHAAPEFEPDAFHALLPFNRCPPVCYLFKRSVVCGVGGFDPDRGKSGHEDWDLLLRIADRGGRFATVPKILADYRVHAGSTSQQRSRMYDTSMAVLAKTRAYHPPCPLCGDRFAKWVELAREDYYHRVLGQAMRGRQGPAEAMGSLAHFVSRSIRDPSLAWQVLKLAGRSLRQKF